MSNNEQMCIAISWVSDEYEIMEDPIGLFQVPRTDATTLTTALRDVLFGACYRLTSVEGKLTTPSRCFQRVWSSSRSSSTN